MKKLLAMLLAGVMVFGLAACGSKDDAPPTAISRKRSVSPAAT